MDDHEGQAGLYFGILACLAAFILVVVIADAISDLKDRVSKIEISLPKVPNG